jgi:hypothetical protein
MTGRGVLSIYRTMKWFSRARITAPSSSLDGLISRELVKSNDTQQCKAIMTGRPIDVGISRAGFRLDEALSYLRYGALL